MGVDYIVVAMVLAVQAILLRGDSNSFHKPNGSPFIRDDVVGQNFPSNDDRNIQVTASKAETAKDKKDLADKHWRQLEQLQLALNETKDAIVTSNCDHGLVQVSLLKMQTAMDALQKVTEETVGPKRKNVRKHNRSASVAYEALAFE